MPPKKTEAAPKAKSASGHATYQDMIHDAITQLKDRNGSRYAISSSIVIIDMNALQVSYLHSM